MIFNRGNYKNKKTKLFTKADLRDDDLVVRRDGSVEVAMPSLDVFLVKGGNWSDFNTVSNDLRSIYDIKRRDIIRILRPVFEREWAEEMTLGEIEKKLGCKIKLVDGDNNA